MRKVFLIALFLVSWYLAGFFHAAHIMALTVAEAMVLLVMYPLSWYLRGHVQLDGEPRQSIRLQADETVCTVTVENTGALPVTKAQLKWQCRDSRQLEKGKQTFSIDAKEKLTVKLPVHAALCGLLHVNIKKSYLWDYLGLFRRRFAAGTAVEVAVLPLRRRVRFCFGTDSEAAADAERELFQIREYQQGDRARDIAWKQSVRGDSILVKEYREISDAGRTLFLDFSGYDGCAPETVSAFYEVLYGIAAGLLADGKPLSVCWRLGNGALQRASLASEPEIDLLLCRLYKEETQLGGLTEDEETDLAKGFCLDLGLHLSYRKKRIAGFKSADLGEQLERTVCIGEGFDEK